MDGGVRETICTNCIHREVCMYKQRYLEYLDEVEKLYSSYRDNYVSFIQKIDPGCQYCINKSKIMTENKAFVPSFTAQ